MLLRRVAFPDFYEPCLPSPAAKPPAGAGWLHEIKHDGFRMLVRRDAAGVRLFTRNGHDWTGRLGRSLRRRWPAGVRPAALPAR
jgi:bifunctional non-homologous end joining protein LigD